MAWFRFFKGYNNKKLSKMAAFSPKFKVQKRYRLCPKLCVFMKSRTTSNLVYARHGSTKQLAVEK